MKIQNCDIVLIFPPIRTWDDPRNFPAGLGLIAALLQRGGYKVAVIDVNGLRLTDDQVIELIQHYHAPVIGIGGLITTYGWVKRMTRRIRQVHPESKIILGGSVGTSIIETALRNLDIDLIVTGEADDTILELMPTLLNDKSIDNIAGLAFLRAGKVVTTPRRPLIQNLDKIPFPAWELFPMQIYLKNPVVGVGRDVDIITSRGCPFSCAYCYRIFGKRFRIRSAEHVVGEMEALKRNYDVDFISFQDDCFVINKKRVYEICDLIDRTPILRNVRWSCNGRVTVCDSEMLKRLRASGCVCVGYGIESGSEKILSAMKKHSPLDVAKQTILQTRQAGLKCALAFMIAYPGETRQTVMETVEFCKELNIPLSAMMFTCPYPGTALYEQIKEKEFFKKQYATEEDFVLRLGDAVDFVVNLTDMSDEELIALRQEAITLAQQNYISPGPAEIAAQEKELYGEELYRKAQEQLKDPHMQAHRRRHGFNQGLPLKDSSACAETKHRQLRGSKLREYIEEARQLSHACDAGALQYDTEEIALPS